MASDYPFVSSNFSSHTISTIKETRWPQPSFNINRKIYSDTIVNIEINLYNLYTP